MPVIGVVTTEHAERVMEALINPAEVQRVFAMPLRLFLQHDGHSSQDAVMASARGSLHPDIPYRLHFFQLEDLPVCWGLTAGDSVKPPSCLFLIQLDVPRFCLKCGRPQVFLLKWPNLPSGENRTSKRVPQDAERSQIFGIMASMSSIETTSAIKSDCDSFINFARCMVDVPWESCFVV